MSFESSYIETEEYGTVGLTTSPIDESGESNVGTQEQLSLYDFSSNEDKMWGLATKFYILSAINGHNKDLFAHEDKFRDIFSRYSDTILSGMDFKFNSINDLSGNVIYANGKVLYDDGTKVGYIVTSSTKNASFDELSATVSSAADEIRELLEGKQNVLTAGDNIDINAETMVISARDTVYTLPLATETELGGTFLDETIKENSRNPVMGGAIFAALALKQENLSARNGIYITESGEIGVDYGDIAAGSQKPVQGNKIFAELSKKQDNLTFNQTHFTVSGNSISVRFGEIEQYSDKLVTGGAIFNALSEKQNNITFDSRYFSKSSDGNVSMVFGAIEKDSVAVVKSGDIYDSVYALTTELDRKALRVSVGTGLSSYETTANTVLSLDFGHIRRGEARPVSGGELYTEFSKKQNNLTAGDGISIENDVLSVKFDTAITSGGQNVITAKTVHDAFSSEPFFITTDGKHVGIKSATDTVSGIVIVDKELNENSRNPVQNQAITKELQRKQNSLTPKNGISIDASGNISVVYADGITSGGTLPVSGGMLYNEFAKYQKLLKEGGGISIFDNEDGTQTIAVTSSIAEAIPDSPIPGTIYLTEHITDGSGTVPTAGAIFDALKLKQNVLSFETDIAKESDGRVHVVYGGISAENDKYPVKGSVIKTELDKKQDKLSFSSEILCSSTGVVSIKFANTITSGGTEAPSQTAILNKLSEYQKSLVFSDDFTTSSKTDGLHVGLKFASISGGTDNLVKADDARAELAKKQNNLHFKSPFATSTTVDGELNVGLSYGTISESNTLPVSGGELYRALLEKQNNLHAGENVTLYMSSIEGVETPCISAKDTIYELPVATSYKLGGVYLDKGIDPYGTWVVPASSIYNELIKKQDKLTASTGINLHPTDATLSLNYGTIGVDGDEDKPVICSNLKWELDKKQEKLYEGANITIEVSSDGKTYISQTGYVLPDAKETTLGGVYFAEGKLEQNGNYTVPAKTVYESILASHNAIYGANGIKVENAEKSTDLSYFQPFKKKISLDFGDISYSNTTKPVKGSVIKTELDKKNGKLVFDSNSFSFDSANQKVSIRFANSIDEESPYPATASTIFNYVSKHSGDYRFVDKGVITDRRCIFDNCSINKVTTDSSETYIEFPDAIEGRMRAFIIMRTIPAAEDGKNGSDSVWHFPDKAYYVDESSDDSPFNTPVRRSEAYTIEYTVTEIMPDEFLLSRRELQRATHS